MDVISRQAAKDALEREKTYSTAYNDGYTHTDYFKQYNMGLTDGIKALNKLPSAQLEWILCSERLPEDDTEVIVSCTDDSGDSEFSYTTTGWHFKGVWIVGNERSLFVRAWMPLPSPLKEE